MEIFKKSIKYSKPLKDLDNKIKKLDEKLKNTGVIDIEDDSEVLCIQEVSSEKLPKIYDKVEVQKEEEISYNWRESFLVEETDDEPIVVDEIYHKTIGRVESYISESNKELIEIRDQVFQEISESTLLNLPEIKCKIEKVLKIYDQLQEGLLNEPPETQNSDPLTPLNQKFVTTEDLNKHYSLFVNRIQEQIATIGGGGEYRFQYLDGIVGIVTNSIAYDGKYLQWNSATNKAEFVTVSGATYATTAGIATYATNAGVSTSVIGGISSITQLQVTGISTFTSGPVFIGTATSTGTASQPLQVTGGAYVSGSVGIGTTRPTSPLHVVGDASISGLTTTNNLYVAGVGTFLSSGLNIRNPANTFGYTIAGGAIGADYTLTLPVVTANTGIAVTGLSQTFSALQTFSGGLTVGPGAFTHSVTTNNFTAQSYTTGTVTIGGPSQTGTITLGQATVSQTTNIQAGASGVGTTKTINFGTGGASGSFTQINIGPGPSAGVGTVVINSGTNLLVGTTTATGTASQPLQVTGGAYFNGSVGIGTTNPVATLQVKDALAFENTNTTTSSTSQVAVDTFATATFRSAKYQVQMTCPGQIATLGGITTGGSGYTAGTFNVTFSNSSGTGAAAQGTLIISNGTVSQIGVGTTGGSGYTAGDVLTAAGGSGLQVSVASTASPSGAILTLGSITSAGIGYTAGVGVGTTTLTFLGGTGTGAVGIATIFDGVITSATLLQQPTTGTGGTVYYSGSNYTTSTVLTIAKTDVTNTITDITGSVGVSTFTSLTAHGIGVSDVVRVSSTSNGLTAGTNYYVVTIPSTTTFTLGTTIGVGITFTTGSSLSIGFYRNSANAGGSVAYLNAITGVSTNYQVSDLLVLQNGTTADYVEYGTIANNDILGTFAADISGANARLLVTPTYATNTVKVARQAITV